MNLKIAHLQSLNQWFLKLKILDLVNMTYWGFYILFRDSRLYFETFGYKFELKTGIFHLFSYILEIEKIGKKSLSYPLK